MNDEEKLTDLLLLWEELAEQGTEVPSEELCKDCPHLAEELARRIEALKSTAWVKKPVDALVAAEAASVSPLTGSLSNPASRILGGRYRLEALIAEGGFAQVWSGFDLELKRRVAIKLPKPSSLSSTEQAESFLNEARKLARLRHPNIVAVHDVGREDGTLFIICDLIEGSTLAQQRDKDRLPEKELVRILGEVAEALHYAHEQGFIHRDIKLDNILLDERRKACLADFGITIDKGTSQNPPDSKGTLAFMSPEQLTGERIDHRTDLYSLGVCLYYLLTDRLPFDELNPIKLREQIIRDTATAPRIIQPKVSREIERICVKCLAKQPDERYPTGKALAEDLRQTLHSPARRWFISLFALGLLVALPLMLSAIISNQQPDRVVQHSPESAKQVNGQLRFLGAIGSGGSERKRGQLQYPVGVAIDDKGNVYVTDTSNHRIQVLTEEGRLIRAFGNEGSNDGELSFPQGIALTRNGNVVVADFGNHRLHVFDNAGRLIKSIGKKGIKDGEFHSPRSVTVDSQGRILVADEENNRIQIFDAAGKHVRSFGTLGNGDGQFRFPFAVACGPSDQIYVADTANYRAQVFDKDGRFLMKFGQIGVKGGEFGGGWPASPSGPRGIAVNEHGIIFVTDTYARRVQVFDPKGAFLTEFEGVGESNMVTPHGIAVNRDGIVAVADYGGSRALIFKWSSRSH